MPKTLYNDPRWKRVRLVVLERDRYQCQLRLSDRCKGKANQVHHKYPTEEPTFDPADLVAACVSCNNTERKRRIDRLAKLTTERSTAKPSREW
jgi:5-methylcytosine-specific restriction endonuclease McrA